MMNALYVVLAIEVVYLVITINRFIRLRQSVVEAWSDVTVQLTRRNDVLEQMLPVIKASKDYEAEVSSQLVKVREGLTGSYEVNIASQDATNLQTAVATMIANIESNPELKTSPAYLDLMHKLHQMENDLQASRIIFNQAALRYNKFVNELPSGLIAKSFGYSQAVYFKAPPTA